MRSATRVASRLADDPSLQDRELAPVLRFPWREVVGENAGHADLPQTAPSRIDQTPPTIRLRAGAQEDEARRGGLSARSPRRAHSKPRYGETGRVSRGASVQREEASAKDETQGWSAYSPHAGRCRTCCSAADPSDNTAPRAGAQEDEARRGGLSARSPRRAHSKPRYGETGRVSRGASVQREEASAEDETQGWSTYSPHAGRCRTCCSAADLSDSTTPRRCSGGRSKARRSFRSLSQTRTQQTSLRRNRTSFERRKCTKRGGVGKG